MNVESWITVEETPALAAAAMVVIDARLAQLPDAERDAFWASIRKAYNTPYNDPAKPVQPVEPVQPKPVEPAPGLAPKVEIHLAEADLPEVDLAAATLASASLAAEMRAA